MSQKTDIKNYGQGKVFESPFLEALTKTSLPVHLVTYGGIVFVFVVLSLMKTGIAVYLQAVVLFSGLLFWTFFEYLMHRYLFHAAGENKFMRNLQYTLHGVHHEYPRDEERVFMPPLPGILIISVLGAFFHLLSGQLAYPFLGGFVSGYIIYSLMHYSMHHLKPSRLLKPLWRHHSLHHYKYPDKAFGVSSTLWDRLFGTMPAKKENTEVK